MTDSNAKISDFSAIRLKVASPEDILNWSYGEVVKPETINYRTQKPEKDGLFCEKIFGPTKDWECYCGKYRRIRYKGIVCDKCGVEVTRSIVRRERMGNISLAVPVAHIWFLRSVPSQIGLLLDMSPQMLEKVIYFASYIITEVNEDARAESVEQLEKEFKQKIKEAKAEGRAVLAEDIKAGYDKAKEGLKSLHKLQILSEVEYHELSLKYGHVFKADIGAEAIRGILEKLDLTAMAKELTEAKDKLYVKEIKLMEEEDEEGSTQYSKVIKKLKLVEGLQKAGIKPEWMFLTELPVIPPDLRPMVALDGGRFATSDLNDLYRRVINRNNRLKRLLELDAPDVICRNEKRMLQEAVDALIDNSARRGQMVTASTGQKRLLRSLADMLKGKQGRFRQNLLGKRVDYSGRSVIVVGPKLKLHQCGLPKVMALELFKPFVINQLIEKGITHNVRSATRLIEQGTEEVYAILEEVSKQNYVLLNRAPTLHRLGIQAFKPILIEGKAIQVHPLVCAAFNADFDGDQMAVHVVLTKEAKEEAENIMLSSLNLLKPSTGEPIAGPTKDIILGCYYMTTIEEGKKGENKIFSSESEAILAYREGFLDLKAKIKCLISDIQNKGKSKLIETCAGRIIFNQTINPALRFINEPMTKGNLKKLVAKCLKEQGIAETSKLLDEVKELGFEYATLSGISWGMDDLQDVKEKPEIFKEAEGQINMINDQYEAGLLTDEERKNQSIEVWHETKGKIADVIPGYFTEKNPVFTMVNSGARGDWAVITQMMGMKGLVINPSGDVIELPVKNSLKEGLNVLEYFISTHGARKGLADTALKTSKAGYLTRRLVDVSQDVIIRHEDCGDKEGFEMHREDGNQIGVDFSTRIKGRTALAAIKDPKTGAVIVKGGEIIDENAAKMIEESELPSIKIRSLVTCKSNTGVCQKCYGNDLTTGELVKLGATVGVVAAQAIGEPGTQLTMRTFHAGGVAVGSDITQGLPRVEEIFESRNPKGKSIISTVDGTVEDIVTAEGKKFVKIKPSAGVIKSKSKKKEVEEFSMPVSALLMVQKGDLVAKGQQLTDGSVDLHELYKSTSKENVQRYIINSVQAIYVMQGEYLNEKHIEVIVRQMFSRIKIIHAGDTELLPGSISEQGKFNEANEKAKSQKGELAIGEQLLLGITKASLTTDSFLSAASFQETARVLINAAVMGKVDHLRGLKENVIIGKLIKAGTGFKEEK